jgi:2-hydroxychromene-2-carboxylate isomerase
MAACWAEERDVSNQETLKTVAEECGMDAAALIEAAAGEEPDRLYDAYTAEALETGVFGAPTYVYRDEMFWGQDRLDFLDRALAG